MVNFKKIEYDNWISNFSVYFYKMLYTLMKYKLLKLSLFGALGAGIVLTLIAKEMHKNNKTDEPTE